jgi:hypothetical protein
MRVKNLGISGNSVSPKNIALSASGNLYDVSIDRKTFHLALSHGVFWIGDDADLVVFSDVGFKYEGVTISTSGKV